MTSRRKSNHPQGYELKVLLLGDVGVGKSSFLQAYSEQRFPQDGTIKGVVDPVLRRMAVATSLLGSEVPEALKTHDLILVDSPALGTDAEVERILSEVKPDIILLCFSIENGDSLVNLATFWLPALARASPASSWKPGWPYLPILLCGLKRDVGAEPGPNIAILNTRWEKARARLDDYFNPAREADACSTPLSASRGRGGAESLVGSSERVEVVSFSDDLKHCIEELRVEYPSIQGYQEASARAPSNQHGLLGELGDVIYEAMSHVMYPLFPLYSPLESTITREFLFALQRIAIILDRDGDGLISQDEMKLFHLHAYEIWSSDTGVQIFENIKHMGGTADHPFIDEKTGFLTLEGFVKHQMMFFHNLDAKSVSEGPQSLFDVKKVVWEMLWAFGYELQLHLPPLPQSQGVGSEGALPPSASASSSAVATPTKTSSSSSSASHTTPIFTLGLPCPTQYLKVSGASSPDASLCLVADAVNGRGAQNFLERIFHRFTDGTLDNEALKGLFSITTYGNAAGGGSSVASANSSSSSASGASSGSTGEHPFGSLYPYIVEHNIHRAISCETWLHLWRMLLVTQPELALKSLFELGYAVQGTDRIFDFDVRLGVKYDWPRKSLDPSKYKDKRPSIRRIFVVGSERSGKTSFIMHYLHGGWEGLSEYMSYLENEHVKEDSRPLPTLPPTHYAAPPPSYEEDDRKAFLPDTLVITEWPATDWERTCIEARDQCDALVLVVRADQVPSLAYFRRVVENIPDKVPTIVVATRPSSASSELGFKAIQAICGDDPAVDVSLFKKILDEESEVREGWLASADSPAATAVAVSSSTSPASIGLNLEVASFCFSPRSKDSVSKDVFRYASARCDYKLDNPMTAARREEEMWARRSQIITRTVTSVTVVVGLTAAVYSGYRWRSHFRPYIDAAVSRARSLFKY